MKVPYWQIEMGNHIPQLVKEVAISRSFSMGRYVAEFEKSIKKLLLAQYSIAVTSGSDSILISLLALGVGKGDKILVQDRSWIAAGNAIALLGATPIFVDVEDSLPVLSLVDLKDKYTKDCKALIIVHMNGRHGSLKNIIEYCQQIKLPIIEDAAQAIGSKMGGKFLGTFGAVGCFSLSITKLIGSGQGGFCLTNNEQIFQSLSLMRIQGTSDPFAAKWESVGFNFRLTDFHAAIATNQLLFLSDRIERAAEIYQRYESRLAHISDISLIRLDFTSGEVGPYIEAMVINQRNGLVQFCSSRGIEIRPFYPCISDAKHLNGYGATPNAKKFANQGIYLPSGPAIKEEQIDYVCDQISNYFET